MSLVRRIALAAAMLLITALCTGLGLDRLYSLGLARLQSHSVMVLARDGKILRAFAASGGAWRFPATTGEVDPKYLRFLIAYEDQRFYRHPGIDPLAAMRAAGQAVAAGGIVSGASPVAVPA